MSFNYCLFKSVTKSKIMSFYRHLSQWSDLNVFKWSKNVPLFAINSHQIEIIDTPNDFYNKLKVINDLFDLN